MGRWYRLKFTSDDNDTFLVTSPEFPEVSSYGETEAEALRWGLDAIIEAIAGRIHFQDDIPPPHAKRPRGHAVELSLLHYLKLALYLALRQKGLTRAELARRMGSHRETVDRLFRLDHNSRMDQLEAAFNALGVPIDVEVPLLEIVS